MNFVKLQLYYNSIFWIRFSKEARATDLTGDVKSLGCQIAKIHVTKYVFWDLVSRFPLTTPVAFEDIESDEEHN